ncbi:uncharacterized protein LOC141711992 [Apium graveolens]|uniref:uncharacterized protein LOC141711992 n=1 Tax=Apium graveolens TaxID=4045 RepID=UPI003D7ADE5A
MEESIQKLLRIRIMSRRTQVLKEVTADFIAAAKGMHLEVSGPSWIPPKVVDIKTRLAPGPDGTNLLGNFELRIHENLVEVFSSTELVEQIISGFNVWGVDFEVIGAGVRGWSREQGQTGASFGLSQSPQASGFDLTSLSISMEESRQKQLHIRIISRRLQALKKVSADFVAVAKGMHLKVSGPSWMPPKVVDIKTRLAPCSYGTNLRGNFNLCFHENLVKVLSSTEVVEQIISGFNEWDVKFEVIVGV